jgi:hypothetical protein
MKQLSIILSLVLLLGFNTLRAQQTAVITGNEPGWYKIAEKVVDFKADRDHFLIEGADKFRAIQLRVTDAHVHFEDMNVVYDLPGTPETVKEDVELRRDFKPGEHSRVIELQFPCLKLHQISFVYGTVPNARYEKAHVEVYGLK